MLPWIVSGELWDRLGPLLPQRERRFRYPGRRPLPDREALCGILYVLHTGISGSTCRSTSVSARTGPSPVDRGRAGSNHHLITDLHGTPLAVLPTGGNRNDVT